LLRIDVIMVERRSKGQCRFATNRISTPRRPMQARRKAACSLRQIGLQRVFSKIAPSNLRLQDDADGYLSVGLIRARNVRSFLLGRAPGRTEGFSLSRPVHSAQSVGLKRDRPLGEHAMIFTPMHHGPV